MRIDDLLRCFIEPEGGSWAHRLAVRFWAGLARLFWPNGRDAFFCRSLASFEDSIPTHWPIYATGRGLYDQAPPAALTARSPEEGLDRAASCGERGGVGTKGVPLPLTRLSSSPPARIEQRALN